jgi:hypothetical protein
MPEFAISIDARSFRRHASGAQKEKPPEHQTVSLPWRLAFGTSSRASSGLRHSRHRSVSVPGCRTRILSGSLLMLEFSILPPINRYRENQGHVCKFRQSESWRRRIGAEAVRIPDETQTLWPKRRSGGLPTEAQAQPFAAARRRPQGDGLPMHSLTAPARRHPFRCFQPAVSGRSVVPAAARACHVSGVSAYEDDSAGHGSGTPGRVQDRLQ